MFPFSHLALAEAPLAGHVLFHLELATYPSSQSHLPKVAATAPRILWAHRVAFPGMVVLVLVDVAWEVLVAKLLYVAFVAGSFLVPVPHLGPVWIGVASKP